MSEPSRLAAPPPDAADDGVIEAEVEQFERSARRIAAGGWRRAVVGVAVGALAGIAAAVAVARGRER